MLGVPWSLTQLEPKPPSRPPASARIGVEASGLRPAFHGWRILGVLSTTSILVQGGTFLFFPVLIVPLQQSFGWSRAEISAGYSLSYLVMATFVLVGGRLADRSGARTVMAVGAGIGCLSLLCVTQIHQLWQFYLAWGLGIGVVMGLTLNEVPFTTIANWFIRMRGRALAIFSGVGGLSTPVLVPLLGLGIATWGWRPTTAAMGIAFGLIMLPAFVIFVRRRPEDLGEHPDGRVEQEAAHAVTSQAASLGTAFWAALRAPSFWFVTTAVALSNLAFGLAGTHLVAYLIGQGYLPVVAAGVLGLVGLVSLPSRVVLSLGTERFGGRPMLAFALLAEGVGIACLLLAGYHPWLAFFFLLFGLLFRFF